MKKYINYIKEQENNAKEVVQDYKTIDYELEKLEAMLELLKEIDYTTITLPYGEQKTVVIYSEIIKKMNILRMQIKKKKEILKENVSNQEIPFTFDTIPYKTYIDIEICDDMEKGLMNRKELPEDKGMLFIFDSEERRSFWMKDTYIDLDIIFIDENFEIVKISKGEKLSTQQIPSIKPAMYVLEVNTGFCEKHNIVEGTNVFFDTLYF
jgi:uncharacterized membrane protein (UPF0127 family)